MESTPHTILPRPPTASILQKQSSFLRAKDANATSPSRAGIAQASKGNSAVSSDAAPTYDAAVATASNGNSASSSGSVPAQPYSAPTGMLPRRNSSTPAGFVQSTPGALGASARQSQALPTTGASRSQDPPGMWGPHNELQPRPSSQSPAVATGSAATAMAASATTGRADMASTRAQPPTMPAAMASANATPNAARRGNATALAPVTSSVGGTTTSTDAMGDASRRGATAVQQTSSAYGSMANMHGGMSNAVMTSMPRLDSAYGPMNAATMSRNNSGAYGSMAHTMLPGGHLDGAADGASTHLGSLYGAGAIASVPSQTAGSAYGFMGAAPGKHSTSAMMAGSMYGNVSAYNAPAPGVGSLYGGNVPGSMYGGGGRANSMLNMGGGGSMYGNGTNGGSVYSGMFGVAGSLYNARQATSGYGFNAQWGSIANMNSQYGGLGDETKNGGGSAYGMLNNPDTQVTMEDICPVLGDYNDAPELRRSGRRGGNHLYAHDKRDKTAPKTSNSQSVLMTIKRRKQSKDGAADDGDKHSGSAGTNGVTSTVSSARAPRNARTDNKPRAKVPSNYNVHTLVVVDTKNNNTTTVMTVQDPNTVVYEKAGKKDKFECDEALEHNDDDEPLDSVLLSELRGNWLSGHNSSLLVGAARGQATASVRHALTFVEKCVARASSERSTSGDFDVSITMAALRGAELCCDVLKAGGEYEKVKHGSSPVYGACLLDLTTKSVQDAKKCVEVLRGGLDRTKTESDVVVAFLVLKRYKDNGGEKEVHLGSLCVVFVNEQVSLLRDVKNKTSSAPYKLLRYAVGGASLTVSMLCIAQDDADARGSLEIERQLREVKNSAPRSGNVKRFIESTEKEVARQKEKMQSLSESEKKTREPLVRRMEDMIAEAQKMLKQPAATSPKGYPMN